MRLRISKDTLIGILDDAIAHCTERVGNTTGNGTIESQLWAGKKITYEKIKHDIKRNNRVTKEA
jgi:hypothetical protein